MTPALALTAACVLVGTVLAGPVLAGSAPTEPLLGAADDWLRVALLRDYNTRVVVGGTTMLGFGAGVIGSYTLLRRRALVGDALSHATLPGIAMAFILTTAIGGDGKRLPLLLIGAAISGVLGVLCILAIRRYTRLKEDTALGLVLSVFFGAGVALLGIAQQMPGGHAAGLESFIYGKTAAMLAADVYLIAGTSAACVLVCLLLAKELRLLCFDSDYASSKGYPVVGLDLTLMAMVVAITILGLQAVGLVLMIALLVTPAAAARFWTASVDRMTLLSGVIGAVSCLVGAVISATADDLPSGAVIVLVAATLFAVSALFGGRQGVVLRLIRRARFERRIRLEHLLRGVYEVFETAGGPLARPVASLEDLSRLRSWTAEELRRTVAFAQRRGVAQPLADNRITLTERGAIEAERLTRQHRLWELYLITHADVAPAIVDRRADAIEHALPPETIARLERLLESREPERPPASPHQLVTPEGNPA
ncbi:MAG: iron chelate uptake ABC transporter family permease subunit [Planctomycetota bacterium]